MSRCRGCSGTGLVTQPEPDGRVLPWSREVMCPECDGACVEHCWNCGGPGLGGSYDADGDWTCPECHAAEAVSAEVAA